MSEPTADDVLAKAHTVFTQHHALSLATTGSVEHSPWVLGAYFVHDGPDVLCFLETHGKSLKNIAVNPRVAFSISANDAMKDFVQGRGEARARPPAAHDALLYKLQAKLPGFALYTPSTPIRIFTDELFVSSFASQWVPAKRWAR